MNGLVPLNNRLSGNGDRALAQQPTPVAPAPQAARKLTPEQQAVMDRVQSKADTIRDMAFPAAMAAAIPVANDVGTAAFKVYRDGLMKEAGSPTDPVEIMLVEQLILAHHRVAQLHAQAEKCKIVEEAKVYMMAAVRLTGELRRLALALSQYRQPIPRRQFTLIRQQNVSRAGQQIAYLDRRNEPQPQVPFNDGGGKLGSVKAPPIGRNPEANGSVSPEQQRLTSPD
jgi:hypothetical protein